MRRAAKFVLFVIIGAVCVRQAAYGQETPRPGLNVFAAASLNEVLGAMAKQFESSAGTARISFNFAGSQQLAQQIGQGAPADLFVSANMKQMIEASKSGRIDFAASREFAHNRLVVVFPKENVAGIRSLHDLGKGRIKIVLADKAVPVGEYSLQVLDRCSRNTEYGSAFRQDVIKKVVSYEENVKAVLSKVLLGEADAGIVYVSDISEQVRNDVGTIEIPDEFNVVATYPVAVVKDSKHPAEASAFMAYLLSADGQALLSRFGFIPITQKGSGR